MSFDYVQTWIIREGFEEIHDKLFRSWILRAGSVPYMGFIRFVSPPKTLPRKRIMIYGFNSVEDWRRFLAETKPDWLAFVRQWLPYIVQGTYNVFSLNNSSVCGC